MHGPYTYLQVAGRLVYVPAGLAETVARHVEVSALLRDLLEQISEIKVFDVVGQAIGANLREVLEAVIAGEMTQEAAAATFGGEEVDPATRARAEELLENALARHHLDWETERDRAARAEERRLPPRYFGRFFEDAITYAGGKVTKRLDPGTWRVDRTPASW